MPGVSTITRSNPAARHAAMASSSASGTSLLPRVAIERKNTCGGSTAFMRMRSPSSAPPPRRRVGSIGQHRDAELVLLVEAEAADQLVGERRLAGAAGAGDPEHRGGRAAGRRAQPVEQVGAQGADLERGDGPGQGAVVAGQQVVERRQRVAGRIDVARRRRSC